MKNCMLPEMYPTELYLIDVMRMVGQLILCTSKAGAQQIYEDGVSLSGVLKKNQSTYMSASNELVMSAACILVNGDIEQSLLHLFRACEQSADLQREELLWKCYINIAQLYEYMGCHNEAMDYAEKAFEIIRQALKRNHGRCRENMLHLFSQPLLILNALCAVPKDLLRELESISIQKISLHVTWKNIVFFLMK